ncbi:ketoacyl-synt-domain-containing protein [Apiospora arundinis]|uniref:Ketoacyl-synt-domain-containing protein n=1 Tax=Apiospora arundinis TaxID=335852 RepID=A0ABR2HRI3_9PEZI
MAHPEPDRMEPIAVVGMGCRFPGNATSPSNLWTMLVQGESAWSTFPEDRVNIASYFHPSGNRQGSICFNGAHFLKQDVSAFDASFFSIPTDEANAIDPQQRMLLEVAVEALDAAGVDREALRKSETGVWVGSFVKDYEQIALRDPDDSPKYGATGNGIAIMSNRISYFLDVNGPSMTIDTGCSASLVCLHNACQALRSGEIDMGLAGGAGLILTPNTMMPMTALNFLSPDGKCYTFDERANGYGRGEGIGIIVLKRLTDAIRHNDNIRGVIRGSRVNQDGRTSGITLPSAEAQIRNIRAVYERAGLTPDQTAFVECHGTGTPAGDHRELQAVSEALCQQRPTDDPMYVGSIKTNLGHLEGCAGIAGVIKSILTIEHGIIPKHLNFEAPGSHRINFAEWKIKVPQENTKWPSDGLRRISVNCFGFGGTNAHVILDDAAHYLSSRSMTAHHNSVMSSMDSSKDPSMDPTVVATTLSQIKSRAKTIRRIAKGQQMPMQDRKSHVFVFSAHTERALLQVLLNQAAYIETTERKDSVTFMEDLAYTLGCRRTKLQWRASVVAQTADELAKNLQQITKSDLVRLQENKTPRVAFVFGGQGAQWFAMGRELMAFDIFLQSLVSASKFISRILSDRFSLLEELLRSKDSSRVDDPVIAQPATTAIQVALVDLLVRYCGVSPAFVIGHSSGEIAAAYAMGAISRETAWELACWRGVCAQEMLTHNEEEYKKGRMLAVGLSASEAETFISRVSKGKITVACINSPVSVTLSGDEEGILEVQRLLDEKKVFNRLLKVETAYHSEHMLRCAASYFACIQQLHPQHPSASTVPHPHSSGNLITTACIESDQQAREPIPPSEIPIMCSSLTGTPVSWEELTPRYWMSNMVSPVLFHDAMTEALKGCGAKKPDIILEIGPHSALQSPVQEIVETLQYRGQKPKYISMLRRNQDAAITALAAVGELWRRGANVKMPWVVMRNVQYHRPKMLHDLPNYPWNRETKYWFESHLSRANRFQVHGRYDLIGRPTADSIPFQPRWRGFFRVGENKWIEDHQVQKSVIYPASGMVTMVIEGAKQLAQGPCEGYEVSDFKIQKAMLIPLTERGLEYAVNMSIREHSPAKYEFFIYSKPLDMAWQQHGTGFVTIHSTAKMTNQNYQEEYARVAEVTDENINPRQFYETLDVIGMNYGPLFQNITSLAKRDSMCSYTVRIPDTKSSMPAHYEFPHIIHPATLDSIFQTAFSLGDGSMVPSFIGSLYVSAQPQPPTEAGRELYGYAEAVRRSLREASVTFVASDESWKNTEEEPNNRALVVARDVTFTALESGAGAPGNTFLPNHHNLCSKIIWEPEDQSHNSNIPEEKTIRELPLQLSGGVVIIVPNFLSPVLARLCSDLCDRIQCEVRTMASISEQKPPAFFISLLEMLPGHRFVWDWSEQDLLAFKSLMTMSRGTLWITWSSQLEVNNPQASLLQALARTIHSENPQKRIVTLDLDAPPETAKDFQSDIIEIASQNMGAESFSDTEASDTNSNDSRESLSGSMLDSDIPVAEDSTSSFQAGSVSDTIVRVFTNAFTGPKGTQSKETEFALRAGHLMVSRLVPVENLNAIIEQSPSIIHEDMRSARESIRPDATYVLAGQGGLAMQIAKLLAENGAQHIALLSRSGGSSKDSQDNVALLRKRGVSVNVFKVDICDKVALQHEIHAIEQTMPQVKGVFQCAATIRDSVFDNMTYSDWQTAVRPKTIGSWNLYSLLPRHMDFFIFLSSSAGVIGSRGQANYAAGNAFQDALARHINTRAMRATSIDLGPVLGAGMLAEDPRTLDMLKASGFFGIRLQDFLCVIERAIVGLTTTTLDHFPAQVVMGVGTGGLIRQNKPADPYWTRTALFTRLNQVDMPEDDGSVEGAAARATDEQQSVKYLLAQAAGAGTDEVQTIVSTGLRSMLAQSMSLRGGVDEVDEGRAPAAYGVDSLVAVGVRNWVFRECGVDVSVFEVLSDMSILDLSGTIVERGGFGGDAEGATDEQ